MNDRRKFNQYSSVGCSTSHLKNIVLSSNKETVKPYESKIHELNSRIRKLENDLETEREKTPELNALREFVFALKSEDEYIPTKTTVTLAELIRGKKIIIVGGHIQWRNKMKEQYPNIEFLDGHSKSLDKAAFDEADFVLFNVSNMSHGLYYKIIGYLRNKKFGFHYLGRIGNQELFEVEMVSILQEKM